MRLLMLLALSLLLTACSGGGATTPPPDNDPPDSGIQFVTPQGVIGEPGEERRFIADRIEDPADPVLEWEWKFGAGSHPQSSAQAEPEVTLVLIGTYTGTVRLRTSLGWSAPVEFAYIVYGPPTITGVTLSDSSPQGGRYVEITATANVPVDTWTFGSPSSFNNTNQDEPTFGFYAPDLDEAGSGEIYVRAKNSAGSSEWVRSEYPISPAPRLTLGGGAPDFLVDAAPTGFGWALIKTDLDCNVGGCAVATPQLLFSPESLPSETSWVDGAFVPPDTTPGETYAPNQVATAGSAFAVFYASQHQLRLATATITGATPPASYADHLVTFGNPSSPAGTPTLLSTGSHFIVTFTDGNLSMHMSVVPGDRHGDPTAWEEFIPFAEVRQPRTREFARRGDTLALHVDLRSGETGMLTIASDADPAVASNWHLQTLPEGVAALHGRSNDWVTLREEPGSDAEARGIYFGSSQSLQPTMTDWTFHRVSDEPALQTSTAGNDHVAFVTSVNRTQTPGSASSTTYYLTTSLEGDPTGPADFERRKLTTVSWQRCGNTCHSASHVRSLRLFPSEAGVDVFFTLTDTSFQTERVRGTSIKRYPWPQ